MRARNCFKCGKNTWADENGVASRNQNSACSAVGEIPTRAIRKEDTPKATHSRKKGPVRGDPEPRASA